MCVHYRATPAGAGLAVAAVLTISLSACSEDSGLPATTSSSHLNVVLLDHAGQPLAPGSIEPYSPRQTCGGCHDVDKLANGYHFQQGRTDEAGNIIVAADYFGDGRSYIHSPGMYGKW